MQSRLLLLCIALCKIGRAQQEPFSKQVIASGFNSAWEVVYGPHDSLWVTENKDYKIQRVSVTTGSKTLLVDLNASDTALDLPAGTQPQGGLMGLALHPALYSNDPAERSRFPYVYAAYVYKRGSCPQSAPANANTPCVFTTKIVRFVYRGNSLVNPVTVLDNIPGSNDHNSGRLVIGPLIEPGADSAHTQYRLYYTVGDMGAGQFRNVNRTMNALNINVLEGKVLRLNTVSDGDAGANAWVPNDNPFFNASSISPRDYVYSFGHRNSQGLSWGTVQGQPLLYSTEQMDKTDDEVNIISPGKSYGWDSVAGFCDGNVNGTRIGQTASANEQQYCAAHTDHEQPIFTLFSATAAQVASMPASNALWPTVALSSVDFYGYTAIPGWNNSLMMSALKKDYVYRLKLSASGRAVIGDTVTYFHGDGNRIRRITIAPGGFSFFVARDVGASANGGTIMRYTFNDAILHVKSPVSAKHREVTDNVLIFPNPAGKQVQVSVPEQARLPLRLCVYDMSGALVKDQLQYQHRFSADMGQLRKGLYIIRLYEAHETPLMTSKLWKL